MTNAKGTSKAVLELAAGGVEISRGGNIVSFGDGGKFSTADEIIGHIAASKSGAYLQKFNAKSENDKLVSISSSIRSAKGAYNSDGTPMVGGRLHHRGLVPVSQPLNASSGLSPDPPPA